MIPSNVQPDGKQPQVSYGGLAGRVDATTWFVIGSCLFLLNREDEKLKNRLQPHLKKALYILDCWEFNGKGLLYTPLSGNWSDEYPIQGHSFYDNLLRLWGLQLYSRLYDDSSRRCQAERIKSIISLNYWPDPDNKDQPLVYHLREFAKEAENELFHFASSLDPTGYNLHFDAAAHGLALLLGIASDSQTERIREYVEQVFEEIGTELVPAFWPVITPDDDRWHDLKNNYSYYFKNQAHHFQNGGIWPVWIGWLGLGFSKSGHSHLAETMLQAWMEIDQPEELSFCEYITSDTLHCSGKQRLSFSAAGLIFLVAAMNQTFNQTLGTEL
jgi:hypothetical protein